MQPHPERRFETLVFYPELLAQGVSLGNSLPPRTDRHAHPGQIKRISIDVQSGTPQLCQPCGGKSTRFSAFVAIMIPGANRSAGFRT